jgi:hypothetical protein
MTSIENFIWGNTFSLKLDASCLASFSGIEPLPTIHVQHKKYTIYGNNQHTTYGKIMLLGAIFTCNQKCKDWIH